MEKRLFTSESVTEGHPDKMCDAISDAILDALMEKDPMSRVACETCATTGLVMVMGEITTNAYVDIQKIVRETVREIGYDRAKYGFDCDTCGVVVAIDEQSTDIAMGVNKALEAREKTMTEDELDAIGAGDQGMMFGFASNETEEYMPYPISLAHKLTRQLTKVRKDGTLKYLRPDGKSQVTVEYDENGKPYRLDAVVLSTQHDDAVTQEQIHEDIKKYVFDPVLPAGMVDENTKFYINPTGRFVIGGPHGDSGLTGRKIIVDTYGGYARHGGGAFSGKDCTKVDRSAAYAARYVAKNMVAAGLADKCEVQLSYAIGVAHPTSIEVDTFGTGKLSDDRLVEIIREHFDLRPAGIIKMLDLRRPIYKQTAAYGHFGRTESTDIAMGVNKALEAREKTMTEDELDAIGAGDQGMMFGFASNETEEYMPYPISLAHKLTRQLTKVRKDGTLKYLRPDGKSQVTVEYDENGKPYRLDAVVLSTQHDDAVTQEQIHEDIKKYVFDPVLPAGMVDENTKFYINPTGRFVIGGPHGDSGLTGRKIIVDTYGGYARHGGGAFSGKDCTKVDRSAAYAARYVAKNMVAAGLADKCEVQLSYAIGVAHPTSIEVDTFGTGKLSDDRLVEIIREHFDLRPAGIIKMLDLRRPIYKQTAAYGHFGRTDVDLPWEKLDKVDVLKKYL